MKDCGAQKLQTLWHLLSGMWGLIKTLGQNVNTSAKSLICSFEAIALKLQKTVHER
jgi:hypothetical protein